MSEVRLDDLAMALAAARFRDYLFPDGNPQDGHHNPLRVVCPFNGWAGGHYRRGADVPYTKCWTAESLWEFLDSAAGNSPLGVE